MQFDRNKLRSVVLYTIYKCEANSLGAVKLHKVCYYSDMLRYAETGSPMMGAIYRKRPFGPTCEQLQSVLHQVASDGIVEVKTVDYFGYMKKEFHLLQRPNNADLASDEIALLDEVIEFVCQANSAKSISEFSHARPWESVEFGEEIRYNSVYHMYPVEVSQEAFDWASDKVSDIEAAKSDQNTVEHVDFQAFRSKVLESLGT